LASGAVKARLGSQSLLVTASGLYGRAEACGEGAFI